MLYGEIQEIPVVIRNPKKEAFVRWPTSEEMADRINAQRRLRTSLGRRQSEDKYNTPASVDEELYKKIKLRGADLDPFESHQVIEAIAKAEVASCERDGQEYVIVLKVAFGMTTVHRMRVALSRDLFMYQKGIVFVRHLAHGQSEIRYRSSVAEEFYKACVVKSEGYAPGEEVPPHHMLEVASELATQLDPEETTTGDDDDPNSKSTASFKIQL